MKQLMLSVSTAALVLGTAFVGTTPAVATAAEQYELVWSDEFNGNSLDRNIWNVEVNGYGGWNNELQYYCDSPENIIVSDGTLKIRALKKNYMDKTYTSARLNSQGKAEFQYGKIEARMKLPSFKGAWPAFWMLGANGQQWPACGEIDIVETINNESIVYGTAHWAKGSSYASSGSSTQAAGAKIDITQWHDYGIEWDANKIVWYVDNVKYHEINIAADPDKACLAKSQYLLLNLAIGGDWPGFNIDNSAFPAQMEVDYVRAYKRTAGTTKPSEGTNEYKDSVADYTGKWNGLVGSWAGAKGSITSRNAAKDGFTANISAIGSDMWGVQASLANIDYVSGKTYTFRSTLTSNVNKNVFIKVEGDDHAELAADYVSLKANQPYQYETTVYIPASYKGNVSLFYAIGGGVNGESLKSSSALTLNVKDVTFFTGEKNEEPKQEDPKTEEPKQEDPKTEEPKQEEPGTEVPSGVPAWNSSAVYTKGDRVTYNGKIYEASWWNQGSNPESQGSWGPWKYIGKAENNTGNTNPGNTNSGDTTPVVTAPAWDASTVYYGGDKVSYNGKVYQASWWNQGTNPENQGPWGPWKVVR